MFGHVARIGLLLICLLPQGALAAAAQPKPEPRIVAIGDIHGDYDHYVTILKSAGLIDSRNDWIGGKTTLVQLGDVTDRGPDSRKIIELLMRLESRSKRAGGTVHFLIGNHEAMNVTGDLRYVHEGEFEAFQSGSSARKRDAYFDVFKRHMEDTTAAEDLPVFDAAYREEWNKSVPLGFVEHRRAWSANGRYGKWVAAHDAVLKINDVMFVHGGVGPGYLAWSIDQLNAEVRRALRSTDPSDQDILTNEDGPLWYRGLSMGDEADERDHVDALLAQYGVAHIVVAHTPLAEAIIPRFGDKVIVVDVGLGAYYGQAEAYLEIAGGRLTAVQRGQRLALPSDGDEGLISYLESAIAIEPSPTRLEKYLGQVRASVE